MKRRNAEGSAFKYVRRTTKRSKNSDGSDDFLNVAFIFIWLFMIMIDIVSEFRLELLYPFWIFLSDLCESSKINRVSYVFFHVFITLTIDMLAYYLVPIHWLLFISSTYVWIQFTWYSEKSFNYFSIFFSILCVSVEAFYRHRELTNLPLQFGLSQPLAAHGIGFPIVVHGIELKSYVQDKLRQHKRRIVAKENEFYYSLLQKAVQSTPPTLPLASIGEDTLTILSPIPKPMAAANENDHRRLLPLWPVAKLTTFVTSLTGSSMMASIDYSKSISAQNTGSGMAITAIPVGSKNGRVNSTTSNIYPVNSVRNCQNRIKRFKTFVTFVALMFVYNCKQILVKLYRLLISSVYYFIAKVLITLVWRVSCAILFNHFKSNSQVEEKNATTAAAAATIRAKSCVEKMKVESKVDYAKPDRADNPTTTNSSSSSNPKSNSSNHRNSQNGSIKSIAMVTSATKFCNDSNGTLSLKSLDSIDSNNCSKQIMEAISKSSQPIVAAAECIDCETDGSVSSDLSTPDYKKQSTKLLETTTTMKSTSSKKNLAKNRRQKRENLPTSDSNLIKQKDDQIWRLETDNQRLKSDLQTIRQCEADLRKQIQLFEAEQKNYSSTISNYQTEIVGLQKKLQNYSTVKQQNLQSIQKLEKQLEEERRKAKQYIEYQVEIEKKARQAEENAARASAIVESYRNVCSDTCRAKRHELEMELASLKSQLYAKDEHLKDIERLLTDYKNVKDKGNMLMSTISVMHDKNTQLEDMLNMEKVVKFDLFTVIEEAKSKIKKLKKISFDQENEIRELKRKLSLYNGASANSNGLHLNGLSSSSPPSAVTEFELVNRGFSCSPHTAASPSSLSSTGTPPLSTGQQSLVSDSLCSPVSTGVSLNSPVTTSSSLFMRDYSSFNDCLTSWPSSITNFNSTTESNLLSSCNHNVLTQPQSVINGSGCNTAFGSNQTSAAANLSTDNPVSKSLTEFDLNFTSPNINDLSFGSRF